MKKILKWVINVLIALGLASWMVGLYAESENNKALKYGSDKAMVILLFLAIIWSIVVIVLDIKDRLMYEKKKIWHTLGYAILIILASIAFESDRIDGFKRGLIFIVFICIYNYFINGSRRDKVRINGNYNLRECKREDADFIYELKKEGFEWYIKDLTGWDEKEQKDIIKKEMDTHLKDMNIIRYDFEDVGLFTYYEDDNGDIFIDMIALMPKARGRGVGSNLIKYLIVNNPNKRLYLKTYRENPARQLYIRNGFAKYDETDTHWWMERKSNE